MCTALHIEHFFDKALISEWEGLQKPDPAIFLRALAKLGVPAEDALFVGDHPENDVRASRAVGMKAVWKRNEQFETVAEADAVIDDLGELIHIVWHDHVRPLFPYR
ncbi:HAD family hydrolase [Brevibacillus borstelensis]|uniref:HAD family hydrolase n=1 Tax=Brevibacillus borstelensis TaxID=45462 RepID=UPI001D0A457A|nr:HAD family hydrolase [Brevibacillus borstelensis]MCC0566490.1 HAD family hydrolase [Brevibacillus borstelensis]MCM3472860.1 HAD family hydrolase [Brevibacillus borstelensis]MCM3561548.1 HAD family hydrolase [Brevibacillus borstelensis]MCM3593331.1 HAD family hydrolase [Brevibacillus borstelensis]MED1854710.1 HAD family hydrolase [Brevibacillus borstelensis]